MSPKQYRTVWLAERASEIQVQAVVCRHLTPADLADVERDWGPVRDPTVDHGHWRWDGSDKTGGVAAGRTVVVGVEVAGVWQGLMAVAARPQPSCSLVPLAGRLFRPRVLYVKYIESAPWNIVPRAAAGVWQYAGVGTQLLSEAVRLSIDAGLAGRVGLHSLRGSEPFYTRVGMRRLIREDWWHEDLAYFEYNSAAARNFLATIAEG